MPPLLSAVRPRGVPRAAALAGTAALTLSACGGGTAEGAGGEGVLTVVTTTSVYADVVREVGGDAVAVDPVIDSVAQDPHSYEATAQDRLAVEDADLVVLNGGGYDTFLGDLAARGDTPVVNAVEASGLAEPVDEAGTAGSDHEAGEHEAHEHEEAGEHGTGEDGAHDHEGHGHGALDEHVWYDLDAMDDVAAAIADRLAELDPDGAQAYRDNAGAFAGRLAELRQRVGEAPTGGAGFVATEPVATYLLEDAGLHDDTPVELTAAVENGTDIPPLVLSRVREELRDGRVRLLAFNAQTASGQTEQLREDARDAGAAVVEFTETLPEGTTYLEWMDGNVTAVAEALAAPRPSGAPAAG